jgi:sugar phosphate isomerase/epimerase
MPLTRRQWINASVAGAVQRNLSAASEYRGVTVGVQSISFRDRPLESMLDAVEKTGLGTVELWAGHVEPANRKRAELREWRLGADLEQFRRIRAMFDRRQIRLSSFDIGFRDDCTGAEIDRMFQMARALGVDTISSSSEVDIAPRLDEFARAHKIRVGFHNLSTLNSGLFAKPDDFRKALDGRSGYLGVTLDVGHFTATGFDPLEFLQKNHQRVFIMHLKDRKRDQGPPVPFGEGDTPVRGLLLAVRDQGWKIPVEIECQYATPDIVAEVKRLHDYVKHTLTG